MNSVKIYNRGLSAIKIKLQSKNWIYIQILYVIIFGFLTSQLRLPSSISYITDVLLLINLFYSCRKIRGSFHRTRGGFNFVILILILAADILGALLNFNSRTFLRLLWGLRNIGRTYLFFFCCVSLLDRKDILNIIKIFDGILFINLILCSYQYWIQGLWCDTVGGIFGTNYGCLSYVNLSLCISVAYHISNYITRREKLTRCVIICCICFYLAAITELKIFFVEFILILVVLFLINRPSLKSLIIVVCGAGVLYVGLQILGAILPDAAEVLTLEGIFENLTSEDGYTNSGDLSRLTAVTTLYDMFFDGNTLRSLFGFGLGNCETSGFSIFNTPFYSQYEYLHYRWMTHAMVYLETGAIGLILFYLFLVAQVLYAFLTRKAGDNLSGLAVVMGLIIIITTIYNSSFRTEAGYIIAFVLSISYVLRKRMSRTSSAE